MIVAIIKYKLRPGVEEKFREALQRMLAKVEQVDGYLGEDACQSVQDTEMFITISYWRDREALKTWREESEHREVQQFGRDEIFSWFEIQITELDRQYDWQFANN